jgi:hypothetical protein
MPRKSVERLERPRPRCVSGCSQKPVPAAYDPSCGIYTADDPKVPSIPVRLSLVKLFLELSLFNPALLTLQGIMASDDQEVEAWYLEGWAFYLMSELARDSPNGKLEGEGLAWEELAKDARDCLETCRNVGCSEDVSSRSTDANRHDTATYSSRARRRPDTGTCG